MVRDSLRAAALAWLAAPALVQATQMPPASTNRTQVTAQVRHRAGGWSVELALPAASPVWAFTMSALLEGERAPWRPRNWRVETPGVRLVREGNVDVLTTVDGRSVPHRVRIAFTPQAGSLEQEYEPALLFSDGGVALYSEQFNLFPLANLDEARALPADLTDDPAAQQPALVRWDDGRRPVLFRGQLRRGPVAAGAQTYVLFGGPAPVAGVGHTSVVDPGLPPWLGSELRGFVPRIMAHYRQHLGPASAAHPTLMAAWNGPEPADRSEMSGGTRPELIVMSFRGGGLLSPSRGALTRARWFFGHESAHFWLGSSAIRYARNEEAWITEGGADLMAIRALQAIDPTYDARIELQRSVDDCLFFARGKPVAGAGARGEGRAYYACGVVFALTAEAAVRRHGGRDWFDFLRPLLEANRADRVLTRAEWLAKLGRVSNDTSLAADIGRLLDEAVEEPSALIASLFQRSGVRFVQGSGAIRLE